MRQTQGHRNVAQAGVYPDHASAARHGIGERIQRHGRPHPSVVKLCVYGFAGGFFGRIAMGERHFKSAVVQSLAKLNPRRHRPLFVSARGAMHQRYRGLAWGKRITRQTL